MDKEVAKFYDTMTQIINEYDEKLTVATAQEKPLDEIKTIELERNEKIVELFKDQLLSLLRGKPEEQQ